VLTTRKGDRVNVAAGLLAEGLAEVSKGRREDEDACAAFSELVEAEAAAKAAKRGLHSGKAAPVHRIADLTFDAAKAKAAFPSLQVSGDRPWTIIRIQ
jgi:staphylococcal nuclease domain-containing protein 1